MATVTVGDVIQGTDLYLTRQKTGTADSDGDVYAYPIYQNYIKLENEGDFDLHINVGKYKNVTIHPGDSFEAFVDFTEFDIKINEAEEECDFTVTTKELGTTPIDTVSKLWTYLAERDSAGTGDLVITGSNKTTSATTINNAIAGATKKHEIEFTFTLKNTAGNKTHDWYNGNMPVVISGNTSTAGVVVLEHDYITFVDGVGKIKAILTGTWAQADVYKVKVIGQPIMGFAVADKELTDTLTS